MIVAIGTDLIEIERIAELRKKHGDHFLDRVFTAGERAYCDAQADPSRHYAARFAAKEAAMKVLGTGWGEGVKWNDVEVLRDDSGKPSIALHAAAADHAKALGITRMHLSLSHSRDFATATALGESV